MSANAVLPAMTIPCASASRARVERFVQSFEASWIAWEALLELTGEHLEKLGLPRGPRAKLLKPVVRWLRRSCAHTAGGDGSRAGQARSITDLAEQEGVTDAYVCRLLSLTCFAPDIVEAILDRWQPKGLRLADVLGNGPLAWNAQRETCGFSN